MSDTYHNAKTWHGLPKSGRKRARADMGPMGGTGVKVGTAKLEFSNVPKEQRPPRPDGRPGNPFTP